MQDILGESAADLFDASPDTPEEPSAPVVSDTPAPTSEPVETPSAEEEQPTEPIAAERNDDGTFKSKPRTPTAKEKHDRIQTLTWEREQAARDAADARAEAARYRQEAESLRRPAQPVESSDPEPDPANVARYPEGQYDRAYIKDQARWEARQEFQAQQKTAQERYRAEQRDRVITQRVGAFTEKIEAAKAEDAEFLERVSPRILGLKPSHALAPGERPTAETAVADALLDSDGPKALMLHLSAHPDTFRRLLTLHPIQVIREIGKIEARLETAPTGSVSAPPRSHAKPPIKPVGSAAVASDEDGLSDDADLDHHIKVYNAREKKAMPRR